MHLIYLIYFTMRKISITILFNKLYVYSIKLVILISTWPFLKPGWYKMSTCMLTNSKAVYYHVEPSSLRSKQNICFVIISWYTFYFTHKLVNQKAKTAFYSSYQIGLLLRMIWTILFYWNANKNFLSIKRKYFVLQMKVKTMKDCLWHTTSLPYKNI